MYQVRLFDLRFPDMLVYLLENGYYSSTECNCRWCLCSLTFSCGNGPVQNISGPVKRVGSCSIDWFSPKTLFKCPNMKSTRSRNSLFRAWILPEPTAGPTFQLVKTNRQANITTCLSESPSQYYNFSEPTARPILQIVWANRRVYITTCLSQSPSQYYNLSDPIAGPILQLVWANRRAKPTF